ncbi:hypothetical protein BGZ61DRAFT_465342, partial [Ilyonectria robusta]|uniref:uncharacterized protein n=1 Tax=Ilyonectria robusta TaxID=1079257 RepID=UPI001E8D4CC3
MLTFLVSRSSLTIASWPPAAAHESGVRPYLVSLASMSTLLVSRRSLTIASWPLAAASQSGVRPHLS